MNPSEPKPSDANQQASSLGAFGFDQPEDAWLDRLRMSETSRPLGRVGSYELLEEISHGGQGIVYRARQEGTKRDVALKRLIHGALSTPLMRARFEREIEAASALNHPNIVTVYDREVVDNQPLLAMEWIDGQPFDRWASGGGGGARRDATEVLRVFAKVCDAVCHAHQRGVIHRDLKPSNILVDATDEPRVLDFGLAKLTADDDASDALTRTTGFVGTPAYASPEQARGERDAIDVRSDVYSLGVMLYQALTGAAPYESDGGFAELLQVIQHQEPKRPSAVRDDLNREIDAIVLKTLSKSPADRYQSVDALVVDLRRYLTGQSVLAHPPSAAYQLRKLIRRHRLGFAFSVTVASLVLVIAVGAVLFAAQLAQKRDEAVAARNKEADARATAEQIESFVRGMFQSVDPRNHGPDVTVRQMLDEAAERVEVDLADHPAVERGVRLSLGSGYRSLALYDDALPHLRRALELDLELWGDNDPHTAASMSELGALYRATGEYGEAEPLYRRVVEVARDRPDAEPGLYADGLNDLALLLYHRGDYEEAGRLHREALRIRRELCATDDGDAKIAISLMNLAGLRYSQGDYAAAEALLHESHALSSEALGAEHPDTVSSLNNLAGLVMTRGRYAEAEEMFVDVLEMRRASHGSEHPVVAVTLNNLANSIRLLGRHEEAVPLFEQALTIRRASLGDGHPSVATTLNNLALTVSSLGDHKRAVDLHRESLAIRRASLGEEHADVAKSLNNLAHAVGQAGDVKQAEALYREALDMRRRILGDRHPDVANTLGNLARLLANSQRPGAAEPLAREALRIQLEAFEAEHPNTGGGFNLLGRVLTDLGQYDEAEAMLIKAEDILAGSDKHPDAVEQLVRLYEAWDKPDEAARWREASAVP